MRGTAARRPGVSEAEGPGWFEAARLKRLAADWLAPRSGAETLTVMVWIAENPGVPVRRKKIEAVA